MNSSFSLLLYRGNDEIKIAMIKDFLEINKYPYFMKSGSMAGVYNALSFTEDSYIYVQKKDELKILDELKHLGII